MALCNVTGLVYLMDGSLARSRVLVFQRDRATLAAEYLGTTVPQPVFAKTDPDGAIDVDLLSGLYEIKLTGPRAGHLGRCVVPDAATARLEDIIDADDLPDDPPVWLGQVIDARDAAEDSADRAEDAAVAVEGAETAINEAQLRKNTLDATRAPLPSDDATQGYAAGSRWLWQGQEWIAVDVTAGAAVWDATVNSATLLPAIEDAVSTFDPAAMVEGAFTPTLTFATPGDSVISHSTQTGRFQKVGAKVTIAVNITATITKGTATGRLRVDFSDLPYVPVGPLGVGVMRIKPAQINMGANDVAIIPQVLSGVRAIEFGMFTREAGTSVYVTVGNVEDGAMTIALAAEFWL